MPTLSVIEPNKMLAGSNPVVLTLSSDLDSYSAKFWAKDFPNSDNYFLTGRVLNSSGVTVIATTTKQQIAASLAQSLLSDLIINKNYYVNSSGVTVTLISKEQ